MAIVLCLFGLLDSAASTPASAADTQTGYADALPQLNLWKSAVVDIPDPQEVGFAILAVPDPRIPRYRRPYDLTIEALQLGMLSQNYVLDRWATPWVIDSAGQTRRRSNVPNFGMMVFRCDQWRDASARHRCGEMPMEETTGIPDARVPDARLRIMYLVPENATQGIEYDGLCEAVGLISAQLGDAAGVVCPGSSGYASAVKSVPVTRAPSGLLAFPYSNCQPHATRLLILGPTFSGTLNSLRAHKADLLAGLKIQSFCVISSSTSVWSNRAVFDPDFNSQFKSLAISDIQKFAKLASVSRSLAPGANVVLLSESSVFGAGAGSDVCHAVTPPKQPTEAITDREIGDLLDLCQHLYVIYFPPTIADIRYGIALKRQKSRVALATAAQNTWPSTHLDLDLGAEDGTEFPDSHQSSLTIASMQLSLDQAIAGVRALDPSMVILVATDVRDRLFLFDQLRARFPRVALIDVETDNLLTHPDFLHASRGALAVSSANLQSTSESDLLLYGCEGSNATKKPVSPPTYQHLQFWPTDTQAIFADAIGRLRDADQSDGAAPCILDGEIGQHKAILNVVGLHGFNAVSLAYDEEDQIDGQSSGWRTPLWILEAYGPLFCLCLPFVWLLRLLLPRPPDDAKTAQTALNRRWQRQSVGISTILTCVLVMLVVWTTQSVGPLRIGPSPTVAFIVLSIIGVEGLWHCTRILDDPLSPMPASTFAQRWDAKGNYLDCCVCALIALAAFYFAASPLLRDLFDGASGGTFANERSLVILGTHLSVGLSFYGVLVLGAFVMHYMSVVLATTSHSVRRNLTLVGYLTPDSAPSGKLDTKVPGKAEDPHLSKTELPSSHTLPNPINRFRGSVLLCRTSLSAIAVLLVAILFEVWLGGVRVSVFGRWASIATFAALCATTITSGFAFISCYIAADRIRTLAGYVQSRVLPRDHGPKIDDEIIGSWPGGGHIPLQFAATPVLARPSDAGNVTAILDRPDTWKINLESMLAGGRTAENRLALFLLLSSEMSIFRWLVLATLVSTLASVLMIYLFPIEADILVGINLTILVGIGVLSGFMAATFEGDGVLSNVLCNRPKRAAWSNSLFGFIAAPFVVLAVAITIVELPGVIDWGGGVLSLIAALGIHH